MAPYRVFISAKEGSQEREDFIGNYNEMQEICTGSDKPVFHKQDNEPYIPGKKLTKMQEKKNKKLARKGILPPPTPPTTPSLNLSNASQPPMSQVPQMSQMSQTPGSQ